MPVTLPFAATDTAPCPSLELGRVTDSLQETQQALCAFNMMLQDLLSTGDGLREETILGIYRLMDGQLRILAATTNEVAKIMDERREEMTRQDAGLSSDAMTLRREVIRTSLGAGADPSVLSQAINLPRSAIQRVVAQLQGEATPHAATA